MKRSNLLRVVGAAALGASAVPVAAAGPPSVRAAFDPIEAECDFFSAQSEGFFTRAGLTVQAQAIRNGAAIAAAILGSSIDLGGVNMSSLLAAHQKGLPFTILALGEMYTAVSPTAQLLVPSDSTLSTARELTGKTVSVNIINGLGHLATRTWIDKNGGDSTAVRYVEMPFSAMPEALASRRVDASIIVEPALSIAKRNARVLADAYNAISREFLISAWVATQDWVAQNLRAAHRFSLAMRQAATWANHHRDVTAQIASRALQTDVAVIRSMTRATFPEGERGAALVQPVIDAAAKYRLVAAGTVAAELFSKAAVV